MVQRHTISICRSLTVSDDIRWGRAAQAVLPHLRDPQPDLLLAARPDRRRSAVGGR
jgi:hypothetical protein